MGVSTFPASSGGGGGASFKQVTVEFNSTASWTAPADVTSVTIFACGGGGGGGRRGNDSGGAAGSGSALEQQLTVTAGSTYTITIGAGGDAGGADGVGGNGGSNTTIGSLLTVLGGGGGRNENPPQDGRAHSGGMGATSENNNQIYSLGKRSDAGNGLYGRGGGGGAWNLGSYPGWSWPADGGGWRVDRTASDVNINGLANYGGGGVGGPRYYAAGNGGSGFVRIKYWSAL